MAKPAVEGSDYPDDETLPMCNCWLDRVTHSKIPWDVPMESKLEGPSCW